MQKPRTYRSLWRPPPSPPFSRGPKNALWSSMRPPCKVYKWNSKRNYYHHDEVIYKHTSWMYKPVVCRSARRSPRQALWVLVEALVPPSPPLPPHLHREVTILNLSPYSATYSKWSHQLARSSFGPRYACPAICLVYTHLRFTMS